MIKFKIDIKNALSDAGITYYKCKMTGKPFSQVTLSRLKKGMPVSFETVNTLCEILDISVGDLLEYVPDEKQKELK